VFPVGNARFFDEKIFIFFEKIVLTNGVWGVIIFERVWGNYARTAMMQEIALKNGNFCGVCPVIGRLNCPVCAAYIVATGKGSALRRPFFLAQSDTHGGVNKKQFDRTQPNQVKLSTKFKEENKPWQTK